MGYVIRLYKPNDGKSISEFFTRNSPYLRDENFWVWINRVLTEKSIVAVAEDNDKIIAHYAVILRTIRCDGYIYNAALGVHAVVDPDYKNELSIFQVSSFVYKEAKNQGVDFIYGFPNANYRLIQEKIERWNKIALFNAYECKASAFRGSNFVGINFSAVNLLDFSELYSLNTLLETIDYENKICFQSSTRYWLNRYALHPQHLYEIVCLSNKHILGYVVCKRYKKNNLRYLHIVDYVFDKANADIFMCLKEVFKFYSNSCDIFSVWKGDCECNKSILRMGFEACGFETFFGLKPLSDKAKNELDILTKFENWRLVMGDSDAF